MSDGSSPRPFLKSTSSVDSDMDRSNYSTRSTGSDGKHLTSSRFYDSAALASQFSSLTTSAKGAHAKDDKDQALPLATIRIYGMDREGIDLALCQLLHGHGCSISHAEQHRDRDANCFFQRIQFDYSTMHTDQLSLEYGVQEVCTRFRMEFQLNWGARPKRICIFVSKYEHVLWDILLQRADLDCEIPLVISNHEDLRHVAEAFGIRFEVFKITKDTKRAQEDKEIALMKELDIDLVVLARYMQIVSDDFCDAFANRVINIHHSFLPAFIGSKPYHRAYDRGVKLIGATAHYATANLDEGPIIEQNIERCSHRDSVDDLLRKGRAVEKRVLMTALRAHIEDRVIVYGNKTVVFED
mmetsp:Transcript_1884/g.7255  ORF Transcript_1884/g.7255 Transcript_1884/m.7255 type:complete len:355 (+) Transcript_1884:198-1262(+)|eukprot:CAMPEP_0185689160 /NCGR_PEP_ID=MMETSP1164-20130828/297_1 /TAXON_ID=1104430 /ORGANISM="Chrysoreinhardia sp, Strain CCMP2950" /LENGTH=354 /DNA_ID=CAMNT_0028355647 /DNA_START=181 /DNA_END=1245 /DNA_ORIENTATION=+